MMKQLFTLLIILFVFAFTGKASNSDSIANRVFTLIYDQNLEAAETTLKSGSTELNDFYTLYLNLDLHWWNYRTTYSRENSQALDELIDASILPETDTYEKKMRQIMVKSYQLRYDKKKFNLFGMLSARSTIRDLIAEIENENPPLSGNEQKLFETFIIMYQYIENVNFFANEKKSAEREKKLKRMEKFTEEKNIILNTVAHFFLARMYQKIEEEPEKGLIHYKILTHQFPTNKTFAEYQKECEKAL